MSHAWTRSLVRTPDELDRIGELLDRVDLLETALAEMTDERDVLAEALAKDRRLRREAIEGNE